MSRFAKKPIVATDINRKNCFPPDDFDSEKTKYLVIIKFTTTPKKKEIANDTVELRAVKNKIKYVF